VNSHSGNGYRLVEEKTGHYYWFCKMCHMRREPKQHWYKQDEGNRRGSTLSAIAHMAKRYGINEHDFIKKAIAGPMDAHLTNGYDKKTEVENEFARAFDHHQFKALLYDWRISDSVSFRQLESKQFISLLTYLQSISTLHQ
jgi:hypothetical protein